METARNIAESGETSIDMTMHADFTYYLNALVTINGNGVVRRIHDNAVKCVDHCTIEADSCQYALSATESYPLRYYKVGYDIERKYSGDSGKEVDVCMCDFHFKPSDFASEKGTASPLLRKEDTLWFSQVENPTGDIYIDRGYATALDRRLRVGEIDSYEQFEKYGNGIFQVIDTDEELV
jgi:hypothetical protein